MPPREVLVLGAGLAGLSTGIHLLEAGGDRFRVRILDRGHVVGGKASSMPHRDASSGRTFTVDHGFHVFFDYPNLGARLEALGAMGGFTRERHDVLMWTEGKVRRLRALPLPSPFHLALAGLQSRLFGPVETLRVSRVMLDVFLVDIPQLTPSQLRALDDVSFDDWARARGLTDELLQSSFFRFVRQSAFIYPRAMSALSAIAAIQLVAQSHAAVSFRYMEGGTSESLVEPLRRHFLRLGGRIDRFQRAERMEVAGGGVDAVAVVDNRHYIHAADVASLVQSNYHSTETPMVPPATATRVRADYYVSALPPRDLVEILQPAALGLPYFAGIAALETQRTIALQLWFDRVVSPPEADTAIVGLPGPFSTVCDLRRVQRHAEGRGSVVQFVGEEGPYATRPDAEIVDDALEVLGALWPGSVGAVIERRYFHRGNHDAFFLTTPGSDARRPSAASPYSNLMLAGDFTQTEFRVISMEGAWISGMRAANEVLRREGFAAVPIAPMRGPGGLLGLARGIRRRLGAWM
ncbi:MAG: FAD-dependent oxidoreductase [Myxococcales bacterium]|nr:FAD-dependent oxidoreductase [Myxococcales bacterium]